MKMLADPSKYQGLIRIVTIAHTNMPFLTSKSFGKSAAISLPAGRLFSKIAEKIAEYAKQNAIKKLLQVSGLKSNNNVKDWGFRRWHALLNCKKNHQLTSLRVFRVYTRFPAACRGRLKDSKSLRRISSRCLLRLGCQQWTPQATKCQ